MRPFTILTGPMCEVACFRVLVNLIDSSRYASTLQTLSWATAILLSCVMSLVQSWMTRLVWENPSLESPSEATDYIHSCGTLPPLSHVALVLVCGQSGVSNHPAHIKSKNLWIISAANSFLGLKLLIWDQFLFGDPFITIIMIVKTRCWP